MIGLRRALFFLLAAGLALACVDFAVTLGSHHEKLRGINATGGALVGLSFLGTGLFAWLRRPHNRFGALMTALAFAWFGSGLAEANASLPFSVGILLGPLYLVFLAHMVLSFPTGRVESRVGRWLLVAGYVDVLVVRTVWWVLDGDLNMDDVPHNAMAVTHAPGTARVFDVASSVGGVVIMAAVVGVLIRKRRGATALQRSAMAPVLWTGLFTLAAVAAALAFEVTGAHALEGIVGGVGAIFLLALPYAFLFGLLRTRYSRAGAVSELVEALGAAQSDTSLRDSLADALDDPTLTLVYWTRARIWVDAEGREVELPASGATVIERDGQPVAALLHDPHLHEEPELVRAAGAAAGLALENERLQAELRARVMELQSSRAKLIDVSMAERRRLERDLHDGAQQRLVALSLQVGLARRKLHGDPDGAAELLDSAGEELRLALEELRELARGIHPAILTDRGLVPALEALADRTPIDVEVTGAPEERLPASVEAAAYFVVAESLTNISKYAQAEHATVHVARRNGHALVEVRDDGVGGADPTVGTGLRGLADRLAAVDGRLEVVSPQGQGTTVRAEIPCA